MLVALSSVCLSGGVLFQYTIGAYTSWKVLSAVCCIVPVSAFFGMLMLPESPNYLVSHNKPDKAMESLAKLRGSTYNLQKEINHLQNFVNKGNASKVTSGKDLLQALLAPSSLKPFGILVVYFLLYQWSGVNAITFYAVEIFKESGTNMDANTATIILGLIRFLFTIVACIMLRRMGRRPLSFISGIGCSITMLILGFYLFYKKQCELEGITPLYTWVPVACIYCFIVVTTVGFLVVPWIMIGEIYPLKVSVFPLILINFSLCLKTPRSTMIFGIF
jgi:SP family facilitated glucose transporter-like MFS transporter 8